MVKSENKRNYGIDLLRIISMFMVVILHVLGSGGILDATLGMVMHNRAAWLLEIAAYCAVNCYALISGYVGVNSKFKFTNIVTLWLQVFFYNLLISVLFWLFKFQPFNFDTIVNAIFPVFTRRYWYFTAYFCMFFFTPALNLILNKMSKKQMGFILLSGVIILSVFPTFLQLDTFGLTYGYSPWWLIFLYLIGGYIKKYNLFSNGGWKEYIVYYICFVLFTFLSKIGFEFITIRLFGEIRYNFMFIGYTSPTILGCAISLLMAFSKMKVQKISKFISFFAPLSFGVYIIHNNPIFAQKFWHGKFVFLSEYSPFLIILGVFACALVVYIGCSLVDFVRFSIFKFFKIKERVSKLEKKYLNGVFN